MSTALTRRPGPLDLLCACLTAGHHGRDLEAAAAAALADASFDLVRLAQLAGRHLITPMLAAGAAEPSLARRLPDDFRLYLEFVHAENSRRNHRLRRQLVEAARHLNRIGVEPVLLKGAIRLVDGLYPDPGRRFMRDLDVIVPRDRLFDAAECLTPIGYSFEIGEEAAPRDLQGLAPDGCAMIELHAELLPHRQELCPARDVIARSRAIELDGARMRVPDTVDQLVHLIAHDRLEADLHAAGMFVLRNVFETALLCRDGRDADRVLARFGAVGLAPWAETHLDLARRLFPGDMPRLPEIRATGRMLAHVLAAAEQRKGYRTGGVGQLSYLAQLIAVKILTSSVLRAKIATNIRSPHPPGHYLQLLGCLWRGEQV